MIVYVVMSHWFEGSGMCWVVFSTRELAEAYVKREDLWTAEIECMKVLSELPSK